MERYDFAAAFKDRQWLDDIPAKLRDKMLFGVQKAREVSFMPYTTKNGAWQECKIGWWTNGFWPASMWQMYLMSGDERFREEAVRAEGMLDEALKDFKDLDHDVGFMWLIHSGVRFALEGNRDSFDRVLFAANMLAGRFNPLGFLRAWNNPGREGWAIIDTMMNLPILYWASRKTSDPRFKNVAMAHANTAIKYFVRPDGSCNHIVIFNPETGAFLDNPAGQGFASGSSWSRGQSWALYGFTLSYLNSGKAEYLDTAKRVADYFLSHLPDDKIPPSDFRQPEEPPLKDDSAGNIAACGLIELASCLGKEAGQRYFDAAIAILRAQEASDANWQKDDPAIFTRCAARWCDDPNSQMTMNYADYFFIEAVNKLRGEKLLFWKP